MYGRVEPNKNIVRKSIKFDDLKRCGIYCITCISTGMVYVGSSNNIKTRWNDHKHRLDRGDHENEHLQNAWNKYSEENFNFSVIEFCSEDVKFEREQYYIDLYKACDRNYGFNMAEKAGIPVMTEESRKKQSESLKQNTEFIEQTRQFMKDLHADSERHQALIDAVKNSEKVKKNLKKLNASPEHKKQVQELLEQVHNDPRIQEIVKNLAYNNVTQDNWRQLHGVKRVVQMDLDGNVVKIWNSLSEIENSGQGFTRHRLTRTCKGEYETDECYGYRWKFEE